MNCINGEMWEPTSLEELVIVGGPKIPVPMKQQLTEVDQQRERLLPNLKTLKGVEEPLESGQELEDEGDTYLLENPMRATPQKMNKSMKFLLLLVLEIFNIEIRSEKLYRSGSTLLRLTQIALLNILHMTRESNELL